jgi:hypothetical protein
VDSRIQIVAIVGAVVLLLVVLELVRRRRLLERYALLWLFSAVILLGLAIWRDALSTLAKTIGIAYPPNALFFIAFAFVLVLLLHFSAAVSRLADQSKVLAQRLALLEERLREHERRAEAAGDEVALAEGDAEPYEHHAASLRASSAIAHPRAPVRPPPSAPGWPASPARSRPSWSPRSSCSSRGPCSRCTSWGRTSTTTPPTSSSSPRPETAPTSARRRAAPGPASPSSCRSGRTSPR